MANKSRFINAITKKLFISRTGNLPSTEKELKAIEGEIGAKIFGPLQPNERRAFFNDNEKSWFFHQEMTDAKGQIKSVTLHYEVHPRGVLRISSQPNVANEFIKGHELKNFLQATEIYHQMVMNRLYKRSLEYKSLIASYNNTNDRKVNIS